MGTLLEQFQLAGEGEFVMRVGQAAIKAAIDVAAEPANTANHAKRVLYAREVLLEPERNSVRFAKAVATNPVISIESSDGDIQFTCNSLFDALAGVE